MLEDYHASNGHQLAVTWLFALYKELLVTSSPQGTSNAAVINGAQTVGGLGGVESDTDAELASGREGSSSKLEQDDKGVKHEGRNMQQQVLDGAAEPMEVDKTAGRIIACTDPTSL